MLYQSRSRIVDRNTRKLLKSKCVRNMNDTLSNVYNTNTRQNNILLELDMVQYNRLKEHCIHLSKIRLNKMKNVIFYDWIRYGEKVSTTKQHLRCSGNKRSRWINMKKSKRKMVLFTAFKEECLSTFPNTHVFGTVMTYKPKFEGDLCPPMSGIVVLMTAVIRNIINESTWTTNIHDMAKGCKTNSLSSYSHHGTKGFVYSFGNKPLYGNNNGSSVSVYATKKSKVPIRDAIIAQDAKYLENIASIALDHGISKLKNIFPEIHLLLSPFINAAFDKQSKEGIQLLDPRCTSNNGLWESFLFVNGRTDNFHREYDCAYTYITVPKQSINSQQHFTHQPTFMFQINEDQKISLQMTNDLSFFYNASFITHRQSYFPPVDNDDQPFYNISSYANEKLFNHLRKSFHRLV